MATDKGRIAVDLTTKHIKEHAEKSGRPISDSEARKKAQSIAERVERKRTNK